MPEPQTQSLPASLPSLQSPEPSDTTISSRNLTPEPPSEASQQIASPSQSSTASAEPSSRGSPESSLTEPCHQSQCLSPPSVAAEDPIAPESPCSQLSTAPTWPSPLESPQLLAPAKLNLDTTWTSQTLDSFSDPGSTENPGAQPSEGLLTEHTRLQPRKGPGAPRSPATTANNWQDPQARSRPKVAELKKCFEG